MAENGGQEMWHKFSKDCSMHGLKSIGNKRLKVIHRILWLLLVLVCFGYFAFCCIGFFVEMRKRITSTTLKELNVNTMQIPSVTICNTNIYKKSAIEKEQYTEELDNMLSIIYSHPQDASAVNRFNWTQPPLSSGYFVNSIEFSALNHRLTYALEDFLPPSRVVLVGSDHYRPSEVFEIVDTDSGKCIQFNANGSFYTKRSGLFGGLYIELPLNRDEYSVGPWSHSEGFQVVVHEPNTVPRVTDDAILIKPSTENAIHVEKIEYSRQPPPADEGKANCIDMNGLHNPLTYYSTYTYSGCVIECIASYVIEQCGCHFLFHPPINGSKLCALYDLLKCASPARSEYTNDYEYQKACNCKVPCQEVKYTSKVSSLQYPSQFLKKQSGRFNSNSSTEYCILNVYFGRLSYQYIEEKIEYQFRDFVANVGGVLGVCLGASVLTLVEFCEFGVLWLVGKFSRQRGKIGATVQVKEATAKEPY